MPRLPMGMCGQTGNGEKVMRQEIIDELNRLGAGDEPFLFVIDYLGEHAYVRRLGEVDAEECLYDINGRSNVAGQEVTDRREPLLWEARMPGREEYRRSFEVVRRNIIAGNSYLANLTCQVPVCCNLPLRDLFLRAWGRYRLYLKSAPGSGAGVVCFSPEPFVRIDHGRISSFPMKGTMDASLPDARRVLMADHKEACEHATIVDLIRNDLSRVATDVRVDRYRYMEVLHTHRGDLLQTSSQISGRLPADYRAHLGDILAAQLPAGSITGAPKEATMRIIAEAEGYSRGFYTGVMGICDQGNVDSAVMIRFLEENEQGLFYKAGGGITAMSDCESEYEEVARKVYLPISR